jgi:hypothetical protein
MGKVIVSSLKPTATKPSRKFPTIDEIIAQKVTKTVTELDGLLADSPFSAEEANALFEAVMADRHIRRRLKFKKATDR